MSFRDESSNILPLRRLQTDELRAWLEAQPMPRTMPKFFIWHHTWSPEPKDWKGRSTLKAIFDWYHSSRGFTYGMGPQFWSAPDGIWIGHHPSLYNSVGATNWNGYQALHMETVWNGDKAPYPLDYLREHAERAAIICGHYDIPLRWLALGPKGEALKTHKGIAFHRQLFVNGQSPKSCPGSKIRQDVVLEAILEAAQGGLSMADIDTILKRLDAQDEEIKALRKSAQASSYREAIAIAKLYGDEGKADELAEQAHAAGFVVGKPDPR